MATRATFHAKSFVGEPEIESRGDPVGVFSGQVASVDHVKINALDRRVGHEAPVGERPLQRGVENLHRAIA